MKNGLITVLVIFGVIGYYGYVTRTSSTPPHVEASRGTVNLVTAPQSSTATSIASSMQNEETLNGATVPIQRLQTLSSIKEKSEYSTELFTIFR